MSDASDTNDLISNVPKSFYLIGEKGVRVRRVGREQKTQRAKKDYERSLNGVGWFCFERRNVQYLKNDKLM